RNSTATMCLVGVAIASLPPEETDTCTRRVCFSRLLPEFQLPPLGRCLLLAPGGEVFWLGDHPPPVPSRARAPGSSGRDRVRPPLQLRGSEGFPPSSLTHLGSLASYVRARTLSMEKAVRTPTTRCRRTNGRGEGSRARRASGR